MNYHLRGVIKFIQYCEKIPDKTPKNIYAKKLFLYPNTALLKHIWARRSFTNYLLKVVSLPPTLSTPNLILKSKNANYREESHKFSFPTRLPVGTHIKQTAGRCGEEVNTKNLNFFLKQS